MSTVESSEAIGLAYHTAINSIGTFFNTLVVYLIIKKTTKELRTYSVLLFNIAICDLIACAFSLLIYQRIVPTDTAYFFISHGPCTLIGSRFCNTAFEIWMHCYPHAFYGLALSLIYRCYVLLRPPPRIRTIIVIIIIVYIPSFTQLILSSIALDTGNIAKEQLSQVLGYSLYSACVSAYLDIFDWKFLFLLVQMTISGIPIYTGILLVRKKIIKTIQSTKTMSEKSQRTHSRLFMAITYQACLPLCGFTTLIFHILGSFITLRYPLCQYGYMIMGLIPVLNPLLTIYFVEPYRSWVVRNFCCQNNASAMSVTRSSAKAMNEGGLF